MNSKKLSITASKIFLAAADYIKNYGWQVSGMGNNHEPRCSMGALASAYNKKEWEPELSDLMYKQLYAKLNGLSLTQFNYKYQSPNRVIKLFTDTAKSLLVNVE